MLHNEDIAARVLEILGFLNITPKVFQVILPLVFFTNKKLLFTFCILYFLLMQSKEFLMAALIPQGELITTTTTSFGGRYEAPYHYTGSIYGRQVW